MQLVTVFVLYIILRKFFFEKVHDFVQKRESTVKEAFDSAEATNRKADEKLEAYSIKIAQIESEGREIIRESKLKADEKAKEIIDEANTKAMR
jgi:F-type H+-transporting ATPase subunit b